MKARDALVKEGLAKPGRGKFSNAAKEWLDGQVAKGVKFDDYPKGAAPVKSVEETEKPTAPVASDPRDTPYILPSDYRFPEAEYKAVGGNREYSLRECCNTCRVSLVNHACDAPTIHDNIVVSIVRR